MALNLEERFERYRLAYLPSPIHRLERLSKELGAEIWAKRDDVSSGLAFGGNKIRKLEARSVVGELEARRERGYSPALPIAWTYLGLGETIAAFDWLETALAERDPFLGSAIVFSAYDALRDQARFQATGTPAQTFDLAYRRHCRSEPR